MAVRAAGFVIFKRNQDIEYLLMQTSYGKNHWTPPKGHLDQGETEYIAALRETKEEAGLHEADLRIYPDSQKTLEYYVQGKPKIVTYWLAELINKNSVVTLSSEHQAFKWLSLSDACQLCGFVDFSNLLHEYHKIITEN